MGKSGELRGGGGRRRKVETGRRAKGYVAYHESLGTSRLYR